MENEKRKVNTKKNIKTSTKKVSTAKNASVKKTNANRNVSTKKVGATKKTVASKKKTSPKKVGTSTTKKAVKKVVNSNASKNNVNKNIKAKKDVENNKVELPTVELKKTKNDKIVLSTNTLYTIIGLVILVIVVVLCIFITPNNGTYSENNNNNNEPIVQEEIPESKRKELNSINIEQYLEMLKGAETKVIYIGRPTCGHCVRQKPIMENIKFEYDVEINYLNTDEFDENAMNQLISSNEYFSEGFGTPLTLIVKDNKIVDKAVGETSKEEMVDLFKKYSLIK